MKDTKIDAEVSYNKQECIDAFMARDDLNETEQGLKARIIAFNNSLSRQGHDLEHARKTIAVMERDFQDLKGQTEGLIDFAFAIEISRRENQKSKDHGSNGVSKEVQHGA